MCRVKDSSCAKINKKIYIYEEAWTIRDSAVAQLRIRIKGHSISSKGHQGKISFVLHTYAIN